MENDPDKTGPFTAELEDLDKTQEVRLPGESDEPSVEEIYLRSKAKEQEMKDGVSRTIEGILGGPVFVEKMEYVGDGQFKIFVSVGSKGSEVIHSVVVKEAENRFD